MAQKKMGRPITDQPKSNRIFIRVDDKTIRKLDECTDVLQTTRSEVVRKGIDKVYDSLK